MSSDLRAGREISNDPFGSFLTLLARKFSAAQSKNQAELVENPEDLYADLQDVDSILRYHGFTLSKKHNLNIDYYSAKEPDQSNIKIMLGGIIPNIGDTMIDESGNNNDATIYGDPILVDGQFDIGVFDSTIKSLAVRFNRPTSTFYNKEYMVIPTDNDFSLVGLSRGITLYIRFRPYDLAGNGNPDTSTDNLRLIHKYDDSSTGYQLTLTSSGSVRFTIEKGNIALGKNTADSTIAINNLYDVWATADVAGVDFDGGASTKIDCTNDATLWSQGLTKYSWSCWVYVTAVPVADKWFTNHGGTSNHGKRFIFRTTSGLVSHQIKSSAGGNFSADSNIAVPLNQWNFIAGTYDSTLGSANVKVFLNGTQGTTTATLTETLNISATMELGNASNGFTGYMKDFRWWTGTALTGTDITNLYNRTGSPPTASYSLPMTTGTGTTATDSISGSKVATLTNVTWDAPADQFHIYVNNIDKSLTDNTNGFSTSDTGFFIGKKGGNGGGFLNADIFNVWFRRGILSSTDISRHFTNKITTANIPFGQVAVSNLSATDSLSILFDGSNDYVDLTNDATLWSQALTKFSFSLWIYPTAGGDGTRRVLQHYGGPNASLSAQGFGISIDTSIATKIIFQIQNAANTSVLSSSTSLVQNAWNHISCVYDNSLGSANLKIYVNAVVGDTTGNLTETINKSATLILADSTIDFKGNMRDFRWWTTKALTAQEVLDVMNNSNDAPIPNYWLVMSEATGNPKDSISGTKVGTLNGAIWSLV